MNSKNWVAFLIFCCSFSLGEGSYPEVRSYDRTVEVTSVEKADVSLDIESPAGKPLYRLQCHSAGYADDPGFEYSGDFECRLTPLYSPTAYSTLLTEDPHQSRDWESRARFFASDLQGVCAKIPQFGANRSFRLRAMDLTLKIANASLKNGKLTSFTLVVGVRPDKAAKTPIAEAVPIPAEIPKPCKLEEHFTNNGHE